MGKVHLHGKGAPNAETPTIDVVSFFDRLLLLYRYVPDWLDRIFVQIAHLVRRLKNRKLPVAIATGQLRDGAESFSAVVVGSGVPVDYCLDTLFETRPARDTVGYTPDPFAHRVPTAFEGSKLTILRCERRLIEDSVAGSYWQVPDAIGAVVYISKETGSVPDQRGNTDNLRRIRKYELYPRFSRDPNEFSEFYQRAYLPFIRNRYGNQGITRSAPRLLRFFRQGGLLWVERDGIRLAGMLYSVAGPVAKSWILAPMPNQADGLKMGSLGAAYKFLLDFAVEQGCASVDLGLCRSAALDGVFVHKKHWGATLIDSPEVKSDLLLKWRSDFSGLLPWLARSPLIVRDGEGLSALSAVPAGSTSEDCQKFVNRLSCTGLKRILLLGQPLGVPTTPHGASVEFLNPAVANGQHSLK